MTQVAKASRAKTPRRPPVDKFTERRGQLAASALKTLSELGYARTSLREIAQNSEFSHGVLHYYFTDKVDLITFCVREYKIECATRYDDLVAAATSASELRTGFAAAMAETLCEEPHMHRLWYDLRNQSLFEESFRKDALEIDQVLQDMIWRIVSRYAELASTPLTVTPRTAYAMFDGVFQLALLHQLAGHEDAAGNLQDDVVRVLDSLFLVS
ncbi:TetR/AcrR family transcriptional regulator [Fodinicola feengrottensis]|uniref:TetR/AcrR family transcriptional regulator n=1 Tax=Fodinicola feengrottensis TaxID=435914 RepID=A0ABN2GYV8_9ACTN